MMCPTYRGTKQNERLDFGVERSLLQDMQVERMTCDPSTPNFLKCFNKAFFTGKEFQFLWIIFKNFLKFMFNWKIIALQFCVGFCCTT